MFGKRSITNPNATKLASRGGKRRRASSYRPTLEHLEERTLLSAAGPDFNGDGFDDLAVGDPYANRFRGLLNVAYGSRVGIVGGRHWSAGVADADDGLTVPDLPTDVNNLGSQQPSWRILFGGALAWGDFNGDGLDDLAVGSADPLGKFANQPGSWEWMRLLYVLYGSPDGLSGEGHQFWAWSSSTLAAGDFNGDGFADLAIGADGVTILHGSPDGLPAERSQFWTQDSPGVHGQDEAGDGFGSALAVGDFNGDGRDDLAVGVPGEDVGGVVDAGAVNVLFGRGGGLSAVGDQLWSQATPGMMGQAETGDRFGTTLAAGDFNGDGRDDLAIGVPGEDVELIVRINGIRHTLSIRDAGAVNLLYGTRNGLSDLGFDWWTQDTPGVLGTAGSDDRFGFALAVGDFNGDGRDDLAIGVPGEAGAVNVLYGGIPGLTTDGNQLWSQARQSVHGRAEKGDQFGFALAAHDFNGDGRDDLAIGVIGEDGAGAVALLFGRPTGLTGRKDELWQELASAYFGMVLA